MTHIESSWIGLGRD